MRRKCRLPYLRHASFGRWWRAAQQPAQRGAERCGMRRYVRSRCSWALLYHSRVLFRPGFSRTVTLFPSKAVRISSKGGRNLGYGDGGWKRPPIALVSGRKCRTLKRSRGIHATRPPPPNVAHPKPRSETEQIENRVAPSPATNQAIAPETRRSRAHGPASLLV